MRKIVKTILMAGVLTGLTLQPVYGAGPLSGAAGAGSRMQAATRVIRMGGDGDSTGTQTADAGQATAQDGTGSPGAGGSQGPAQGAGDIPDAVAWADQAAQTAAAAVEQAVADPSFQEGMAQAAAEQAEALAAANAAAQAAAAGTIRQLDPTKPMIALTYDDGPQSSVGNRIMDVMNLYGGKCTFFMVGDRVPSHAAEVIRMVNEGFEVANHTQNHKYLNRIGAAEIRSQVEACNNTIQSVTGVRPTLMRLPGGNKNATVLANVGMPVILWNVDTLDWKTRNAQSTISSVLGKVKDGDIILMHELYSATADATERLVPALVSQGFQLVTVSELAHYKGVQLNPGQIYNRLP